MKLSAVILAKNAQDSIEKTLNSVPFCDEIVVIDDYSTDKTVQIVKNRGVKVILNHLDSDFSKQRNLAFSHSRGDWLFYVDADEVVTPELTEEIKKIIKNNEKSAYYIKRRDHFWGRELRFGELLRARRTGFIRLVKKNSGHWSRPVHEEFQTKFQVGRLNGFLDHYPHPTIKGFLEEVNFYSTIRARELQKAGTSTGVFQILAYPFGKFFVNYFLRLGFLDGPAGFVYAFMMSFHSFLVRAKLYQYTRL
jgi:glycosyltransferase involved in cell wall biosynthesis